MDMTFEKVTIVGLGLIGGSWGLALKKWGLAARRVGFGRASTLARALAVDAVDEGTGDLGKAVQGADLIILAAPVGAILDCIPRLKGASKALVTDVGSTKRLICERARDTLGADPLFLGGHPLAGKERAGVENADATLFANARYVLTPIEEGHLEDPRIKAFVSLLSAIGARPYFMEPDRHDRALAFLSHLPQLVSSALASLIAEESREARLPVELAATGLRDVTRLAESPYSVWRDICLTNLENIQPALEVLVAKLEFIKQHLSDRELEREFQQASKLREKLRESG
ncbi:MAG TPA: prephenate dehydrogenase [Terriglobia bacterium]|nr:prephenate dehydrogenase [Terriglobia bacterium]